MAKGHAPSGFHLGLPKFSTGKLGLLLLRCQARPFKGGKTNGLEAPDNVFVRPARVVGRRQVISLGVSEVVIIKIRKFSRR